MKLGEKHIHTHAHIIQMYIHISLFIKDVPKNISSLYVKHRDSIHTAETSCTTQLPTFCLFLLPWSH